MRNRLAGDLGRWETGELSLVELEARHPGHDVGALVGVHTRMARLTDEPVPDPEPAWAVLSTALAAHPRATRRRQPSRRRFVAAIVAATLAMPGLSYAAAPDAVRAVARHVTDLLPGAEGADPVAPDDDRPSTTSTIPAQGEPRELDEVHEVDEGTGTDSDEKQDRDDPDDGRDDAPAGDLEESEEHSAPSVDEDLTEAPEEQAGLQAPDSDDD